jgi:UDP-N-acetylmuramate--alanine ligase
MNIYFSGIGGVGLGPLAEIAKDAGHRVQGTDTTESLTTQQLTDKGIAVSADQSGEFLRACHEQTPIDWLVYTAGLPTHHPELETARALGIKTSKRDELLASIIKDNDLKLIAVVGTHGKTGTTALLVWTLQQLGVHVSYSVGSTMSFGPSGKYDPESHYFVYECDEFDRNFLHFSPHLSLVTSLDYDHPDTYPSADDYLHAFGQFLTQSDASIMWQRDGQSIATPNTWLLGDHEVAAHITLSGEHTRRNATLVLKAIERLGLPGDAVAAINQFPGVDRRFEKLQANLYSDYGHHPAEIAATLQMAKEVSDAVVLVYQPHQNVRQHEVQDEYTNCFELAETVYWLPTYLSREDPNLPILSPQELTKNITNRDAVHVADLNDVLWETVQQARGAGKLVLFMGAGSIDTWVRQKLAA